MRAVIGGGQMMTLLTWMLTGIALYGTWLNANKAREGFYWWCASNFGFAIVNFVIGQYALTVLFSMYLLMAIQGLRQWKK